jgi:hypothetical protein
MHAHMLNPQSFMADMSRQSRKPLLDAEIAFPLAQIGAMLDRNSFTDNYSLLKWEQAYPDDPYQLLTFHGDFSVFSFDISMERNPFIDQFSPNVPSMASGYAVSDNLDLAAAVMRQWSFSKKITRFLPAEPAPYSTLHQSRDRYLKFMYLMTNR